MKLKFLHNSITDINFRSSHESDNKQIEAHEHYKPKELIATTMT